MVANVAQIVAHSGQNLLDLFHLEYKWAQRFKLSPSKRKMQIFGVYYVTQTWMMMLYLTVVIISVYINYQCIVILIVREIIFLCGQNMHDRQLRVFRGGQDFFDPQIALSAR